MSTTVRELINVIGWKVDQGQLNTVEAKTKKFTQRLKTAALAIGVGITAIGTVAINAAADMEALTAQFEVMLGSVEKANEFVKQLQDFSKSTPFQLKDLAENSKIMLSFGIAQEDVMKNLRMLGDVAGNSGEKLGSLTLAFSQIQSTGKLMGQDLLQLINAGFNPLKVLSEKTGKSMAVLKEEMSKGQISAEMVTEAFKIATSEGGLFFQNMEKQSKTLKGLISTMKDNINLVLVQVGNKLLPAMKEVVGKITELFQGNLGELLGSLMQVVTPIIDTILTLVESLSKALVPVMNALMKVLLPILDLVNSVVQMLIPVLDQLATLLVPVLDIVGSLVEIIKVVLEEIIGYFAKEAFDLLAEFAPLFKEIATLLEIMSPILIPIVKLMTRLFLIFFKLNTFLPGLFFKVWVKGFTLVLKLVNRLLGLLKRTTPIFNIISNIIQRISDFIQNLFDNIFTGIENAIFFIFNKLNMVIEEINKLPFMKETQIKPFDMEALKQEMIKRESVNNQNNQINMTNNNTFNGLDNNRKGAIKRQVQDAIGTPFQLEILRVIQEL